MSVWLRGAIFARKGVHVQHLAVLEITAIPGSHANNAIFR